jgi:hypothetical protein
MMPAGESTAIFTFGLVSSGSREAQRKTAPRLWRAYTAAVVAKLRDLGPYAAILVLPGGSVMALLLWLYRRQKKASFLLTQ